MNSRRPTPLISRQISHKPSLLLLVPFPQDKQIDHLFVLVRLSVNLGRTLVDLFVWTDKSSSNSRLHRRTNRRTNLFVPFSHQTICPSETICLSSSRRTNGRTNSDDEVSRLKMCSSRFHIRRFVRPNDLFGLVV